MYMIRVYVVSILIRFVFGIKVYLRARVSNMFVCAGRVCGLVHGAHCVKYEGTLRRQLSSKLNSPWLARPAWYSYLDLKASTSIT